MILGEQRMHVGMETQASETNWFTYDCPYKLRSNLRISVEFAAYGLLD